MLAHSSGQRVWAPNAGVSKNTTIHCLGVVLPGPDCSSGLQIPHDEFPRSGEYADCCTMRPCRGPQVPPLFVPMSSHTGIIILITAGVKKKKKKKKKKKNSAEIQTLKKKKKQPNKKM
eukprot:NODE_12138_length_1243_cov_7.634409.p3 GENE.NODE_12138_length_1243_cov_7.634409~~NODE_12138_length_1243_cov_7.634409.p3  ORF type:complete len:118 (-),score=30.00 NODE_12138_length_1243_cov_7.634409:96-449(-)